MASNPPGACCTVGVKHEGTPTGTLEQIDGSPSPPSPPSISRNRTSTYTIP